MVSRHDLPRCHRRAVPRETSPASDEHPICQTYVDTCLLGCLERGGVSLAERWASTTGGWSVYWLNDLALISL